MLKAKSADEDMVVEILAKAYDSNETINETIIQDKHRKKRLRNLMKYSFKVSLETGCVYLSDNKQTVALIVFPDQKKTTLKGIIRNIHLLLFCTGIIKGLKAWSREVGINKTHLKGTLVYHLWYLGTNPASAGSGNGTALMNDLISDSLKRKRSMHVEARVEKNMRWYQKFGFNTYHAFENSGRKWYCMKL